MAQLQPTPFINEFLVMNLRFFPIAAAILLTVASSGQSRAAIQFGFDPDGTGGSAGSYDINSFDIAPGNALAHGAAPGGIVNVGDTFELLYQAKLTSGALNNAGGFGTNDFSGQLTVVARFPESVTSVSGGPGQISTIAFGDTPVGENYFRIYYNSAETADDLTGLGFDDGDVILEGRIVGNSGAFTVFPGTDYPDDTVNLDQFNGDSYNGQQSVFGVGAFSVDVRIDDFDSNFFTSGFGGINMINFGDFDGNSNTPFAQANPSETFDFAGITPELGDVNGRTGPDFQFQADASISFTSVVIPEPASLAVFAGLGVLGLGGVIRRRRQA